MGEFYDNRSPDPPNYPDPESCPKCNERGSECDFCGEPMADPELGDKHGDPGLCCCAAIPDGVNTLLLSQLDLLGYTTAWTARKKPCSRCGGEGFV